MKLNDVYEVESYKTHGATELSVQLSGTTMADALRIDGEDFTLKTDTGEVKAVYKGFQIAGVCLVGELVELTACRKIDERTAEAIQQLETNLAIAQDALEQAQAASAAQAMALAELGQTAATAQQSATGAAMAAAELGTGVADLTTHVTELEKTNQ